jgi:glycine dehydrogenase subunit 1
MLFEFQTQVAHLTGMEVANASMYDGSTATAEAVLMARRLTRRNKHHPLGRSASPLPRRGPHLSRTMVLISKSSAASPEGQGDILNRIDETTAAIVVQTPDFYGHLRNIATAADAAHAAVRC